jgi:hypothetical protein
VSSQVIHSAFCRYTQYNQSAIGSIYTKVNINKFSKIFSMLIALWFLKLRVLKHSKFNEHWMYQLTRRRTTNTLRIHSHSYFGQ